MQFIREIHRRKTRAKSPVVSFEFFPPKTAQGEVSLFEKTLPRLAPFRPDYCSVTYGAGGSTRAKTLEMVSRIQRDFRLTAMSHLTCVNARKEEILSVLDEARQKGIKNILALRGDPPGGTGEFQKTEGGFEFSFELVRLIRELDGFSIGVAGFPEGHIACREGKHTDWERLRHKIDQGADFVITQLFFENRDFFEFWDYLRNRLGVRVPICPGVLPVLSARQIKRFTELCGATIPPAMFRRLEALGEDDQAVTEFGIDYATAQCEQLLEAGVPGLHFYTLNKSYSTIRVLENLGFKRNRKA